MHRLSSSFVLGYHGCHKSDGERILRGEVFRASSNKYDWLGTGIYFWEANPERALEFAAEKSRRAGSNIRAPFAIGAVIELGLCLDLASKQSMELLRESYESLRQRHLDGGTPLPRNGKRFWQRYLDCAVINHLHSTLAAGDSPVIDTVKGIFIEGEPIYPEASFREKTHIQIAVRNPQCIRAYSGFLNRRNDRDPPAFSLVAGGIPDVHWEPLWGCSCSNVILFTFPSF